MSGSRGLLPSPLTSALLLAAWLLLQGSIAPGQILLGAALAVGIPLFLADLRETHPPLRRPLVATRLAGVVLWDIVLSNIEVARRILGPEKKLAPRFVWLPLDIKAPYGIATLAGIITMTPGTLSADLSPDRRHLLVHGLHVPDPQALIAGIKARYETPLREIFDA
ncbi:MAG: Na+/H+ antiporter subunit E [Gammaproteobacteria bacterium]